MANPDNDVLGINLVESANLVDLETSGARDVNFLIGGETVLVRKTSQNYSEKVGNSSILNSYPVRNRNNLVIRGSEGCCLRLHNERSPNRGYPIRVHSQKLIFGALLKF